MIIIMYEQKEALLQTYCHLTMQLVNEMNTHETDQIQAILDKRQTCIEKVNQLDQNAGRILLNATIKAQLLQMVPLEVKVNEMLQEEQQKVISNLQAIKKEKKIKQYGEVAYGSAGVYYDKRK